MSFQITGERLTSLFRPRSVALVGASVKIVSPDILHKSHIVGVRLDVPADEDADRDVLTAVIARIGDLALALGDSLESLEVNPLLADGTRIEALDAVVTWREHS